MKNKPNLFIVGAPKCGTTFLCEQLNKYSTIYFSSAKEINYFSFENLKNNSYYNDYKIETESNYLQHFKKVKSEKWLVDGSVSYFAYKDVAKKIYNFNSNAKIIILLRDPVKRAFSHFQMDKRMGHVDFEFDEFLNNFQKYPLHFHQYIQNSLYFENIKNFLEYFDRKNVLILTLENLENNIDFLLNFLELEDNLFNFDEKINENKAPKNKLSRIFQKNRNFATKVKLIIPKKIINIFSSLLYSDAKKEVLVECTRKKLCNLVNKDIDKLSELINEDLTKKWSLK